MDNPLKWNDAAEFGFAERVDGLNEKQAPEVDQVFDWYSAPIKRVDKLELYYQAHRMANRPLIARQIGPKVEEEKKTEEPSGAGAMMGGPGGPGMPGMSSGGKGGPGEGRPGGFGGEAGGVLDPTPNGLERKRYVDLGFQDRGAEKLYIVRRMPVAMVVVMDQAYIPDFLTAFANSRLRIQTTQEHWQHVQGIRPNTTEEGSAAGAGPFGGEGMRPPTSSAGGKPGLGGPSMRPPGGAGGPRLGGGAGEMRPPNAGGSSGGPAMGSGAGPRGNPPGPRGGGFPGAGFPGSSGYDPNESGMDEEDPNLVELAVYGIASLYERFPPKPPPGADAGSSGTPATPPAPGK